MQGVRIDRVLMRRPDLRYPLPDDFVHRLQGQTVRAVRRRAKYLAAELSSGDLLRPTSACPDRFVSSRAPFSSFHTITWCSRMASGSTVVFNDPRRFGSMRIVDRTRVSDDPVLSALGPEPLARRFDGRALALALGGGPRRSKPRSPISASLQGSAISMSVRPCTVLGCLRDARRQR